MCESMVTERLKYIVIGVSVAVVSICAYGIFAPQRQPDPQPTAAQSYERCVSKVSSDLANAASNLIARCDTFGTNHLKEECLNSVFTVIPKDNMVASQDKTVAVNQAQQICGPILQGR